MQHKLIQNIVIAVLIIIGLFMLPFGETYVYGIAISLVAVLTSLYLTTSENKSNGKKNTLAWISMTILIIIPISYLVLASTGPSTNSFELLSIWAKFALASAAVVVLLTITTLFSSRR